jgi:hypothetical protein
MPDAPDADRIAELTKRKAQVLITLANPLALPDNNKSGICL